MTRAITHLLTCVLVAILLCVHGPVWSQISFPKEKDYADYIQTILGGDREVSIDGGRIDLLTEEYAIEIKRAPRWKEAIGQSMWYAMNTNKKPAIILILEDQDQYKYFLRLNSALAYANLDTMIHVLLFPNDFEDRMEK